MIFVWSNKKDFIIINGVKQINLENLHLKTNLHFLWEWFDFTNSTFLFYFIIFTLAILIVSVIFIFVAIANNKIFFYRRSLKKERTTVRVYAVDVKRNICTYFNLSDISEKHNVDLNGFYNKFHTYDREKVKNWLFNICSDYKNCNPYLEVDITTDNGKGSYFSLLKLNKYNPDIGVIHVESHILKHITPTNTLTRKKRGPIHGVVKRSSMESIISREKSLSGFTFAIRFFYLKQQYLSNDKIERYQVMTLKNEIFPYVTSNKTPRQIVDSGNNEILLFDLKLSRKEDALTTASSIAHSLRKCIEVNGFTDSMAFAIGLVRNSEFYQDFDTIVEKAQQSCMNAERKNVDYLLYQKENNQDGDLEKYQEAVEHLLKPHVMRYLYRPIIDVTRHNVIGYFEFVKAYDSPFASFQEMSKYAEMVGKNRTLFSMVAKTTIQKFASQSPDKFCRLFLNVSLKNVDHMLEILPQIAETRQVNLVLVFDEQEVNENAIELEILNKTLEKFKHYKYELALMLKDKNLLLDSSVYFNFDFFVIGASMLEEIRKNNRIRLSIHTLIEQLLKYQKPIIATDLEGWQPIELIIKSGINIVSSETLSPCNDMLLPIEKKKMDKLIEMDEKFN